MLTSLHIENFKGFRELDVAPLAKVNLLVGTSNVGKTSLLEAICLLPNTGGNPEVAGFRDGSAGGGATIEFNRWLLHASEDASRSAVVQASRNHNGDLVTFLRPPGTNEPNGRHVATFGETRVLWNSAFHESAPRILSLNTDRLKASELARLYDQWTLKVENDERFISFLSSVEPRLRSLRPMEHSGSRMLYADIRLPERIALPLLGEGFNRLVEIYGALIGEGANILLIDEIENGLHWSALPQVWKGIREAVNREQVQIFATTHSKDCIEAAVEVFKGEPKDDLAVHRLERADSGDIRCVTMGEDQLERMLERGWEVR